MGALIALFGTDHGKKPIVQREIPDHCPWCELPLDRKDAVDEGDTYVHYACLHRSNDRRAWRAVRSLIVDSLAFPLVRAIGVERVQPVLDRLEDDATTFSQAFTVLATLESLVNGPDADPACRAAAKTKIAGARDAFRTYLRRR